MAWTKAQLAAARKMYRKPGNRKSWADCIAAATKGGKVSGTRTRTVKKKAAAPKKTTVKKVTVVKARKATVKVAGMGAIALSKVKGAQEDIQRLEKLRDTKTGAERKQITQAISGLKKFKNSFKKFL